MNFKNFYRKFFKKDIIVVFIIIFISIISFIFGRLSNATFGHNISFQQARIFEVANTISEPVLEISAGGKIVASVSGTKYHYPWCSGAKRIKESNLISFSSVEEARVKGYGPAKNCKGLK